MIWGTPTALILMAAFLCANFVAVVLLTWMPKFLYEKFHLSLAMAGLTATIYVQFASMIGSPLGGWMADALRRRTPGGRMVVQAIGVLAGAPFVVLCGATHSPAWLIVALTAWGLCKGLYDANIFASMFDVIRPEARGTAAGFMNMVGWLGGGGTAPVIIAWIATQSGLSFAISVAALVYVAAGLLLIAGILFFIRRDAARIALGAVAFAAIVQAQEVKVWSEFQRIDPFGQVVAADRVEHPREILSPAVPRNAWTSFHVAVTIPENVPTYLYVQQNPEWFDVTVYKEEFKPTPEGWIPDRLREAKLPCLTILPDAEKPIPRQTTAVYWLDIWAPEKAEVGRMRMQVLLNVAERWLMYPMEIRVVSATVPKLPAPAQRDSIRPLMQRNARQYEALAKALKVELPPPGPGAEGPLKVRDFLLRQ